MRNKKYSKGFTLAELLIVVAIIAVLVAVAIPVFNAQLRKARHAVDIANARAIYAELSADYLSNGKQTYYWLSNDGNENGEFYIDSRTNVEGNYNYAASEACMGTIVQIYDEDDNLVDSFTFNGTGDIDVVCGTEATAPYVTFDGGGFESESFGTVPTP